MRSMLPSQGAERASLMTNNHVVPKEPYIHHSPMLAQPCGLHKYQGQTQGWSALLNSVLRVLMGPALLAVM